MPRSPKVDADKLGLLQQRLAKAQRDLRHAQSLQKKQARADDARRKIIAGALALEHMAKNPGSEFGKTMLRLLDEYTRPHERPLFDFLPVRDAPPSPAPVPVPVPVPDGLEDAAE
jgi:hypothetical protein